MSSWWRTCRDIYMVICASWYMLQMILPESHSHTECKPDQWHSSSACKRHLKWSYMVYVELGSLVSFSHKVSNNTWNVFFLVIPKIFPFVSINILTTVCDILPITKGKTILPCVPMTQSKHCQDRTMASSLFFRGVVPEIVLCPGSITHPFFLNWEHCG